MTEIVDLDPGEDRYDTKGELEEIREKAHLRELAMKQSVTRQNDTGVTPRSSKGGDLVCKRSPEEDKGAEWAPNWEGPFRIQEAYGNGAYRLETLQGETLPRTWNVMNLKFYYS
jgi:hypothetical protein